MKFESSLRAKIAQFFKMGAVGGGVQFRGHHNHRFLGERGIEFAEFAHNDFEIAQRVALIRVACIYQVSDQARTLHVFQKTDSEPDSFMRALDQARQIRDYEGAAVSRSSIRIGGNDAQMRFERSEWIGRDLRLCG